MTDVNLWHEDVGEGAPAEKVGSCDRNVTESADEGKDLSSVLRARLKLM